MEDIDFVMLMPSLLEHRSNVSDKTGRLWFYSKDEANSFRVDIVNTNNFKCFKCKAKLV